MPEYRIGGQTVSRKNLYMPCIIGERVEQMTDEEHAAVLKANAWADMITNAEWPVVLGHSDASKFAKARLKKKVAFWMIAMARIAVLNPELFAAAADFARSTYSEQVEEDYPVANVIDGIWGGGSANERVEYERHVIPAD